jgi:predicted naringenin-chalcone synthase
VFRWDGAPKSRRGNHGIHGIMFIKGIGTAVPANCYTQRQCWDALHGSAHFEELAPRARAILKKVLTSENGIATRHLVLEKLVDAFEIGPDVLHARFVRHAPKLSTEAALQALQRARVLASEIDAILISTCTGYLCPGLTSYVSEALGLRPSVLGLDLVGQGCGAALPNLMTAEALLAGGRRNVLSICVEVCSAAFYLDNDPGVLISACLFGDGAAAAVLGAEPGLERRILVGQGGSRLAPERRELLKFEQRNGMLRNVLSPKVPELAAEHAHAVFSSVLTRAGLSRDQIRAWILHPGGREVLAALARRLDLSEQDLSASAAVLRRFGNLSSPSVLFILESCVRDSSPGGYWWMTAFGAGFSCHGVLLEVE